MQADIIWPHVIMSQSYGLDGLDSQHLHSMPGIGSQGPFTRILQAACLMISMVSILLLLLADPQGKRVKTDQLRQDIVDLQEKPIADIQLPEKVVSTPRKL